MSNLLSKISNFENLYCAFLECARGKRKSAGFRNFIFSYGEKLKSIEEELKSTKNYQWSGFREFYVHDPKKRLIMAAPFKDRVVHTAIHRIIGPIVDKHLGVRIFACRIGMGNRNATIRLLEQLKGMGEKRYCIKLDVRKYFQSISHNILYERIIKILPDESINKLMRGLIASREEYNKTGRGVPIGNLTSQLFANFYLRDMDYLACELLGIDFYEDKNEVDDFYIRYMDDSVIISRSKKKVFKIANALVWYAKEKLHLNIPKEKTVILACDPIPFLGFVVDHKGYRNLRRNERKIQNKIKRYKKKNIDLSKIAQVEQSYNAWRYLSV